MNSDLVGRKKLMIGDRLALASPVWFFLFMWIAVLAVSVPATMLNAPWSALLEGVGFFFAWVFYPLCLVFFSKALGASRKGKLGFFVGVLVLAVMMIIYVASGEEQAGLFVGKSLLLGLIIMQFSAAHAFVAAEKRNGLDAVVRCFSYWFFLMFLPFFGYFILQKRHFRLVNEFDRQYRLPTESTANKGA
ncbi:MAG: hypothetical protein JJT90_17325 [Ectothiorhodospiraceae bacterium]|nr:hypothetical protein [Ectothiorhodospiraceae bacterium]